MKKLVLLVAFVLLVASPVKAQAVTLVWTAPDNVVSLSEAISLTYTMYINNGAPVVLSSVTCAGALPTITCQVVLPPSQTAPIGTRFELTAKTATSAESPRSVPFIKGPNAPTNLRTQ